MTHSNHHPILLYMHESIIVIVFSNIYPCLHISTWRPGGQLGEWERRESKHPGWRQRCLVQAAVCTYCTAHTQQSGACNGRASDGRDIRKLFLHCINTTRYVCNNMCVYVDFLIMYIVFFLWGMKFQKGGKEVCLFWCGADVAYSTVVIPQVLGLPHLFSSLFRISSILASLYFSIVID